MVGKLQDFVAASVVVGAVEKTNANKTRLSDTSQVSKNTDIAKTEKISVSDSPKFIVDIQGMEAEDDGFFRQDEQEEFHLEPGTLDEESVDFMTKELNELMSKINCNIEFTYHQDAGMMSVKMVDKETQEVIKELPPEEMIENMVKAKDWLGAFLDKTI